LRREIHPTNGKCNHVLGVLWFFFLLSFGFKVGRLEGRFFFQDVFGVKSGLANVHSDIGHSTFHASFIGGSEGERGGFIFLSANRKGQGALLLFL